MKCRDPAIANGGMLSMATRVARKVVPHDRHTASHAQYARRSCLGDESDAGLNGRTIQRKSAVPTRRAESAAAARIQLEP